MSGDSWRTRCSTSRRELDGSRTEPGHADLQPAPTAGASIGRYLLLHRLGSGSHGSVFAGRDLALQRSVAIKLLAPSASPAPIRDRLRREARTLARIVDEGTVEIFDVGLEDERAFIVMELVEGETFDRWMKTRPALGAVLEALTSAALALAAAHDHGIVHRDFKPQNMMVEPSGRARVLDLGLARGLDASVDPRPRAGTPRYMAPEQYSGNYDARSDQYAFCLVAWEALFGDPFPADNSFERLGAKLRGDPRATTDRSSVPQAWIDALRRGLAPDPDDRFASLRELVAAARRRPRRSLVRAVGVALVGLAAIAGFTLPGEGPSDPPPALTCGAPVQSALHQSLDARLVTARALLADGELLRAYAQAEQVEREARASLADPLAAKALVVMGEAARRARRPEDAELALIQVLSADSGACADDIVSGTATLLYLYATRHDLESARRWMDAESTRAALERASAHARARWFAARGLLAMTAGDPETAVRHTGEALALAEQELPAGHLERLQAATIHGATLARAHRPREALDVLGPAIAAAEAAELSPVEIAHAVGAYGLALLVLRDAGEAVPHLQFAYETLAKPYPAAAVEYGQSLATAHAQRRDVAAGRALIEPLRELAIEVGGTWSYELLAVDRVDALLDAIDGRYELAAAKLVGCLGRAEALFGPEHGAATIIHGDLHSVYEESGERELAELHAAQAAVVASRSATP